MNMNSMQLTHRYELMDLIGSGTHTDVFRARDVEDGRLVAIKRLRDVDQRPMTQFVREAEVMARVEHPMALPVLDFGRDTKGHPFLVTDLLDGESLASVLSRGPLDPLLTVRLIRQISDVLAVAHGMGFVHRDIQPANIWIQTRYEDARGPNVVARLLDWSVTYMPNRREPPARASVGSPQYRAPEQTAKQPLDGRADLYSLGVVAYECLSGWPPQGEHPLGTALQRLTAAPLPLAHTCPNLDRGLCHLVERLLASSAQHRPSSAHVLNRLLSEIEQRLTQSYQRRQTRRQEVMSPMAAVFCLF